MKKMKKMIKLLSVFAIVILMSGCVKYDIGMTINNDNSLTIEFISAVSKDLIQSFEQDGTTVTSDDEATQSVAMKDKGYSSKEYNDDKYTGEIYSKTYKSIDEISTDKDIKVVLNDIIDTDKEDVKYFFKKDGNIFKDTYTADFIIDLTDSENNDTIDMSAYTSSMELNYHITLPNKAGENNATTKSDDGKKLEWKLEYGKKNEVKFQYTKINMTTIVGAVCIGILIIIIIVILIIKKMGKKQNKNSSQPIETPQNNDNQNVVNDTLNQQNMNSDGQNQEVVTTTPIENSSVQEANPSNQEVPQEVAPNLEVQQPIENGSVQEGAPSNQEVPQEVAPNLEVQQPIENGSFQEGAPFNQEVPQEVVPNLEVQPPIENSSVQESDSSNQEAPQEATPSLEAQPPIINVPDENNNNVQ